MTFTKIIFFCVFNILLIDDLFLYNIIIFKKITCVKVMIDKAFVIAQFHRWGAIKNLK